MMRRVLTVPVLAAPLPVADSLVPEKNPLDDITHTRALESVWIEGRK